jgi:soluble lytic murein transglycosylase
MLSRPFRILLLALSIVACRERGDAQAREDAGDVAVLGERSTDPAARAASDALAARRPWLATRTLAPALADSARRTPEVVYLAAVAASEWGGWEEVDRLLADAPWVDTLFGGRARTLLARAALAREQDSVALAHATAGLLADGQGRVGATQLVLRARALDRLQRRDSARMAYERASELLPDVADWLLLRAASVTDDPNLRAEYYATLRTPVAKARVGWTEAVALERGRAFLAAARAFDSLGSRPSALRMRLLAAPSAAARAGVRRELVELVAASPGSSDARTATEILDADFPTLTPAEELVIARSAARSGPLGRARSGFLRAFRARLGTARDRFTYADVLMRMGRDREAAAQFARITGPSALAGDAAYQRARALLASGQRTRARDALRAILRTRKTDTSAAASALFLLGDLATDDGRDAAAREAFRDLATRYPTSPRAPAARFRAATIAYATGATRTAAAEMDTLWTRWPNADDALAAGYWSARAWARRGDSTRARARWREVAERSPLSYYAMLSARRLGEPPWAPPAAPDSFPVMPRVDSAVARARMLEWLGMDFEARLEYDRLASDADSSVDALLATARAFERLELGSRAITLAWRAIDRGTRDARTYRLAYPIIHQDMLLAVAREHRLDPALMAALIRQESSFNPRATSGAGARGLMQVMPSLGQHIARSLDFPTWSPALLYEPDANMQVGAVHLRDLDRQYGEVVHLLAAYNAGGSRVARWRRKTGAGDPEMFTERIPFDETRDYVRIVQRNRALYAALYEWGDTAETGSSRPLTR